LLNGILALTTANLKRAFRSAVISHPPDRKTRSKKRGAGGLEPEDWKRWSPRGDLMPVPPYVAPPPDIKIEADHAAANEHRHLCYPSG
jgi:hypothetical protein